jgi:hypothetical protein
MSFWLTLGWFLSKLMKGFVVIGKILFLGSIGTGMILKFFPKSKVPIKLYEFERLLCS